MPERPPIPAVDFGKALREARSAMDRLIRARDGAMMGADVSDRLPVIARAFREVAEMLDGGAR